MRFPRDAIIQTHLIHEADGRSMCNLHIVQLFFGPSKVI